MPRHQINKWKNIKEAGIEPMISQFWAIHLTTTLLEEQESNFLRDRHHPNFLSLEFRSLRERERADVVFECAHKSKWKREREQTVCVSVCVWERERGAQLTVQASIGR